MNATSKSKSGASLLLLSGGLGQRTRHHEPKQFYELAGHPIIAHSIIAAIQVYEIAEIVTNAPAGFEERTEHIMRSYCGNKPYKILPPGKTRQESCYILANAASYETVIVHESARPFVDKSMFKELLDCSEPNAGYCLPLAFSICQIDPATNLLTKGLPRNEVFNIQLPQKFDRSTLLAAHEEAKKRGSIQTEDAVMCVEMVGAKFLSLTGSSKNLKVTTEEDFAIAEQIMGKPKG